MDEWPWFGWLVMHPATCVLHQHSNTSISVSRVIRVFPQFATPLRYLVGWTGLTESIIHSEARELAAPLQYPKHNNILTSWKDARLENPETTCLAELVVGGS